MTEWKQVAYILKFALVDIITSPYQTELLGLFKSVFEFRSQDPSQLEYPDDLDTAIEIAMGGYLFWRPDEFTDEALLKVREHFEISEVDQLFREKMIESVEHFFSTDESLIQARLEKMFGKFIVTMRFKEDYLRCAVRILRRYCIHWSFDHDLY